MIARFSVGLLLALFITLMLSALRDVSAATRIAKLKCGPHDDLVGLLKQKYSEHRAGFGVSGKHFIVEAFRSAGGSFTV